MKKVVISLLLIWAIVFNSFAIGVDSNEVKTNKTVNFINYQGDQIVSPSAVIKGIGVMLSRNLKQRKTIGMYHDKYSVVHAIDSSEPAKLNADIMSILATAQVNHIGGLRLILAGYLEDQYGYSLEDARLLSYFITVYNAVYRKDLTYFGSKYKSNVMQYLTTDKAGISIRWDEWSGNTQLLIPIITELKVIDSAPDANINTSPLTDAKVLETLKQQDDKGLEERKDLVNLQEKEVQKDKQEVVVAKEEVVQEKEQLQEEKKVIEEKKAEIAAKEAEIAKDKAQLTKITDEEKKVEKEAEIAAKAEEVAADKEAVKQAEEKIVKDQEAVVNREETIVKKEEEIVKKEEAIAEDKKDIEKDEKLVEALKDPEKFAENLVAKEEELKTLEENLVKNQLDEKTFAGKFYYLRVEEWLTGGHYTNSLYILNAATGEILVKSPVANISGRKYDIAPNVGVVVITHKGVGSEFNYISILDLDTLQAKYTSTDPVFHRSFVEVRGDYIYIVSNLNNSYYLGKYDLELKRVAVSTEKVYEDSYITFYGDRIYINDRDDKIMALNKDTLKLIERISPK